MRVFPAITLLLTTFFCACTSSDYEEPTQPISHPRENIWNVEMSASMDDIRNAASKLDSLETAELHFKTVISVESGMNILTRGYSFSGKTKGNITKLGQIKTLWKYGVGQNLVPAGLCGAYSISDWYEVSGSTEIEFPWVTYRSKTGVNSGWSGRNIENPQTPFQYNRGTDTEPDFVTFIYDIKAGANGSTPPGGHLWVPVTQDSVRLYFDIIFP